ncbi:MAG: hypothetical protein K2O33_08495 [Muribaculaceae bacterium]|nr:hypothetical protein [Muribaculaceae bacterium]
MPTNKYKDEQDRALGLGGMAASLVMWENARYIQQISLDAPVGEGVTLTPDFFQAPNQRASAKAVWTRDVEIFHAQAGMVIANLASRAIVGEREAVSAEQRDTLVKALAERGREACGLEEPEVAEVARKILNYFSQVLVYPAAAAVVSSFAARLVEERTMERGRVIELLSPLERL